MIFGMKLAMITVGLFHRDNKIYALKERMELWKIM